MSGPSNNVEPDAPGGPDHRSVVPATPPPTQPLVAPACTDTPTLCGTLTVAPQRGGARPLPPQVGLEQPFSAFPGSPIRHSPDFLPARLIFPSALYCIVYTVCMLLYIVLGVL